MVYLSEKNIWDTLYDHFQVLLVEEEIRRPVPRLPVPQIIYMVETSLPCRVETNFSQYDTVISDLDCCMGHVSVVLYQYLHVERLIDSSKVRFEYNVQIHLAHTNCR